MVPDPEVLLPWAKDRGMSQDLAQLCREAAVVAAVHKGMLEEGRAAQLRGFEQVGEQTAGGRAAGMPRAAVLLVAGAGQAACHAAAATCSIGHWL